MHIICPHCTTSYAIDLATLGGAGRTVRCSRCKEVWLARPEDAIEAGAPVVAMAEAGQQASAQASAEQWGAQAEGGDSQEQDIPVVESPSISSDWSASADAGGVPQTAGADWPSAGQGRFGGQSGGRRGGASAAAVMVPKPLEAAGAASRLRQIIRRAFRPLAPPWARWCWR